ncbi:uncharacterized protein LOC100680107 isoform X2 [Nasonia vitripennis]|uniref:C2H2-type domain-containing protein n=1 Tax=Nasonia vitripennis TaxID=7425 RepID=A0A7M7M7A7_NASVI|nr:uncharacterized protein LOC100680107 isoform X2 [Nasonia vitripennis]
MFEKALRFIDEYQCSCCARCLNGMVYYVVALGGAPARLFPLKRADCWLFRPAFHEGFSMLKFDQKRISIVEHPGIAMFSHMEEQRSTMEHRKEYRKKYYAERRQEIHNNLLRAKGAEIPDTASQENREMRVLTTLSSTGASVKRRTRGKRLFDSDGLVLLHCKNCNTSRPKINYQKETKCKYCDADLKFQCIKCDLVYKSHMACVAHIKFKHPDAKAEP